MKRRKKVGLTQLALANAVGVQPRTVQRWEAGEKIPTLNPLEFFRLCSALQCSAEDLARDFYPEAFASGGGIAAESPGEYS